MIIRPEPIDFVNITVKCRLQRHPLFRSATFYTGDANVWSLPLTEDALYRSPSSGVSADPDAIFIGPELIDAPEMYMGMLFVNQAESGSLNASNADFSDAESISFNATVHLTVYSSYCVFMDETVFDWSSYGCQVGPSSSSTILKCHSVF